MTRISTIQRDMLDEALNRVERMLDVKITTTSSNIAHESTLEYGVNWGGMGTKKPEEAYAYANRISTAATIAGRLNLMGLILDRKIKGRYEDCFDTEEEWDAYADKLAQMLIDSTTTGDELWKAIINITDKNVKA